MDCSWQFHSNKAEKTVPDCLEAARGPHKFMHLTWKMLQECSPSTSLYYYLSQILWIIINTFVS